MPRVNCPSCGGKGFNLVTKVFNDNGRNYNVVVREPCSPCGTTGKITV